MAVKPTLYDNLELAVNPDTDVKATVKVNFSYRDSGAMSVDLSDEHAKEFDTLMERYLTVAAKATKDITRTRSNRSDGDTPTPTRTNTPTDSEGTSSLRPN